MTKASDRNTTKFTKSSKSIVFVGSIQISEGLDKQALRDQVSVSLSEAADGLDVLGGHVGVAVNENGEKYLVWALKSVERDSDSEAVTATIYVVDAGDATNTTSMTKEFDRSHKIEKKIDKISNKIERLSQSSGDADIDAARAAFVEKFQEIKEALESGDSERASELRDELKDLRSELGNIKSYRK